MAELEASFEETQLGALFLWRQPLPDDREVSIGRNPLSLASVPPEKRAEWVTDPRDVYVSGCHTFVRWDGVRLQVRVRTEPDRPQNAIFYKGEPKDNFALAPGEKFVIGNTHFTLHAGDTVDTGTEEDARNDPQVTQFKLAEDDLRNIVFHDPAHIIRALSGFPDLIRYSPDETTRTDALLRLVTDSLRQADVAALVQVDDRAPGAPPSVRRVVDRRPRRDATPEFRPSARLCLRAMVEMENTLHIRGQRFDSQSVEVSLDAGLDWQICAPLGYDGSFRIGLYAAGRLTGAEVPNPAAPPAELRDYQKVIGLAAQIYASAHDLRQVEQKVSRYTRFLSPSVVGLLNAADADELLRPRESDVTVLFCDLRGSCRLAECGTNNLLDNWNRISAALDIMTRNITDEGGVIGDLQGDAAMGFWGWPFAQPDQVARAARAALKIQRDFARRPGDLPADMACGIGLAHGRAVAGRLGTYDQIKLDVFGPVVNRAARLEGLTKLFGVPILADEAVGHAVRATEPIGAQTRTLGRVCPAGMVACTTVSELAAPGAFTDRQRTVWEAAVNSFTAGRFSAAREKLEQYRRMGGPAARDRAADLLHRLMAPHGDKPPDDWDGVIRPEAK